MPETVALTPMHYAYLAGVLVILTVMILRRDTPAVCIAFLFLLGLLGFGTISGAIMTVFNAILYAGKEFMEIFRKVQGIEEPEETPDDAKDSAENTEKSRIAMKPVQEEAEI